MGNRSDAYVLGREDEEYARLNRQAAIWEAITRSTLARAGIASGETCVDVGCGTGTAMRILGEMVGPTGSVLGVDVDERIGHHSVNILNHEQPGRHRFVRADIAAGEAIEGAPFDVVFARLLVFHMRAPVEALASLWSLVAPGGRLVVMDFDLAPVSGIPPGDAIGRGIETMHAIFTRAGRDIRIGTQVPGHWLAAGIGDPDEIVVNGLILPRPVGVAMLRAVLRSLREAAIATGTADGTALDGLDAELADAATTPGFVRVPDMVSVMKRKQQ